MQQPKIGILTISDRGSVGDYEDKSGPVIRQIVIEALNGAIEQTAIVPDGLEIIKDTLLEIEQWFPIFIK